MNMNLVQGIICVTLVITVKSAIADELGKCNPRQITQQYETNCTDCNINVFVDCLSDDNKLTTMEGTPGCKYTRHLGPGHDIIKDGCTHTCERNMTQYECCKGYWGPQCDECPGGHVLPCSGHGTCNDTMEGTGQCACDAGWSGYACEFCVDLDVGGDNCTDYRLDPVFAKCQNYTCPNNSKCVNIDDEVLCMCVWPYVEHVEDGETNTTDIECKKIDYCKIPPLCHQDATCEGPQNASSPNYHGVDKTCTCKPGYKGDGYMCDPIDLCQVNNGECDTTTSNCVYTGPGKRSCECKDGYEPAVLTDVCILIDMCQTNSSCDPRAKCTTVAPKQIICHCPENYTGDGKNCSGNIVQTIKDLNEFDLDLKGQLTLILGAIEKYYYTELTEHGPFTMFVPVNEGFRNIDNPNYQEWLSDAVTVRQILRQHMIVGEFKASNLTNDTFYTLQSSAAELRVNWKDEKRFRIHGANRKGKVIKQDIIATNGIIHAISKLMINEPDVTSNPKVSIYENLAMDRYKSFKELVDSCGEEIKHILTSDNVTLFAPSNTHFGQLEPELIDYLKSLKGEKQVTDFVKNHIVMGRVEITDLINMDTFTSSLNMTNSISVLSNGRVMLNENIEITQSDMPATNGLMHAIHGLLITESMNIYPNRCNKDAKGQGKGCCTGFYGPDCMSCPGGFSNACNGHGTCDDGIAGSGNCTCNETFTGPECKECIHNRWGDNCERECQCVRGKCVRAPYNPDIAFCLCESDFRGTNCNIHTKHCGINDYWMFQYCHAHAQCIIIKEKTYQCICKPGYEGTGSNCNEIDPCKTNRGGCHLQATCKKTGPGLSECICNEGFHGNGHVCYLATECVSLTDCDTNARCMLNKNGQRVCQCLDGFHGNGTTCWLDNKCKLNNGGCDPHARCDHGNRLTDNVTCTCYNELGYYGDGLNCKPSILQLIKEDHRLTKMGAMIKGMEQTVNFTLWEQGEHTVFAWTDNAVESALLSLVEPQGGVLSVRHFMTMLKGHTIQGRHSLEYLSAISAVTQLQSLLNGFTFFVSKDHDAYDTYHVALGRTNHQTMVVKHDLEAYNGYVNIIDEDLFPALLIRPNQNSSAHWNNLTELEKASWSMRDPSLSEFMEDYPDYSIFMNALKAKNLTALLDGDDYPFTLFVPSNKHMMNVNWTLTSDYLRYYMVPQFTMLWSLSNNSRLLTDVGPQHQLHVVWSKEHKPSINGVPVIKSDIFLSNGMLNFIDGLLHPDFNWCQLNQTYVEMGPCTVCNGNMYTCLNDLRPAENGYPIRCRYTLRPLENNIGEATVWQFGCQGPCVKMVAIKDCCAGFYGDTCQECPSGPERPCNGHGQCQDGMKGNGSCKCDPRFVGNTCTSCVAGLTGPHCNIDMSGCGYRNGGCHKNAYCYHGNDDVISCQCMEGFTGDGHHCTGPCDDNNGGCHSDATCTYTFQTGVKCSCKNDFVGDGKIYCMRTLYTSLSSIPDGHWFYKSIMMLTDETLVQKLNSTSMTQKFTMFVPTDRGLYSTMSEYNVLQQIVLSPEQFVLSPVDFTNVSLYTMSNQTILVSYNPTKQMFYVNNTKILSGNIKFTNGIVHMVEHSFTPPTLSSAGSASSLSTGAVIAIIACVLLLTLILTAAIIVYRKSTTHVYWTTLNKWLLKREGSTATDNSPLHVDEEDSSFHDSGLPASTKFENPTFNTDNE